MFCKRLSFFERPFEKMEAIFIFCKVRFSFLSPLKKLQAICIFCKLGLLWKNLKKDLGQFSNLLHVLRLFHPRQASPQGAMDSIRSFLIAHFCPSLLTVSSVLPSFGCLGDLAVTATVVHGFVIFVCRLQLASYVLFSGFFWDWKHLAVGCMFCHQFLSFFLFWMDFKGRGVGLLWFAADL